MLRLSFFVAFLLLANHAVLAERPNVVFILADDLGIGDVKCYGGSHCQIETPNIDRMAGDGVRFTDAHVNASVCEPTRVGIMTGRYPWRFGNREPGGSWGFVGPRFAADTHTIGDVFKAAGYRTGYVGKWHLGTRMQTHDGRVQNKTNVDYKKPLIFGPPQLGFDDSFILPGSLDMFPYVFARDNVWQGEVTAQKGWSAFNRVGPAEKDFQDHEVLETFYRESERFLAAQDGQQPFFLYLALTAPHTPTSPGKDWQGKSKLGVYGDFVMEVDHGVERIRKALRRHGLEADTLLIFSSDHGPAPYAGNILKATPGQLQQLEDVGHDANGPHRGYKFSVYEGGLRVPMLATWPGVIPAGATCDELVGLCDLMATFAELASQPLLDSQGPDSISFAALLQHPDRDGERKQLVMQSVGPFVVRDRAWKLCVCPGSGSPLDYGNTPKQVEAWQTALANFSGPVTWENLEQAPFVQLYNLANDPGEDQNLASQYPQRVLAMFDLLKQQIEFGRSTPGPELQNDRHDIRVFQRLPDFVKRRLAAKQKL